MYGKRLIFLCWIIGTANNAGAILVLGRDLVVVPKLIHPIPPAITSPESSPERHLEDTWMQVLVSSGISYLFSSLFYICSAVIRYIVSLVKCKLQINVSLSCVQVVHPSNGLAMTWSWQELNVQRPPTPTRGRPQPANDRGSLAWI